MATDGSTKDWAPCAHDAAGRRAASRWLRALLDTDASHPPAGRDLYGASSRSALEHLLWAIALGQQGDRDWPVRDLRLKFDADQWVAVTAEFALPDGSTHALWTEGDTFTLALARTYERLLEVSEAWSVEHAAPATTGEAADAEGRRGTTR